MAKKKIFFFNLMRQLFSSHFIHEKQLILREASCPGHTTSKWGERCRIQALVPLCSKSYHLSATPILLSKTEVDGWDPWEAKKEIRVWEGGGIEKGHGGKYQRTQDILSISHCLSHRQCCQLWQTSRQPPLTQKPLPGLPRSHPWYSLFLSHPSSNSSVFFNSFFFLFLATASGMRDLSSPTRDQTLAPCSGSMGS